MNTLRKLQTEESKPLSFKYTSLVVSVFYLYGFVSVMLPSGSIFGINVKILLSLLLFVSVFFIDKNVRVVSGLIGQAMALTCFLTIWVLVPNLAYMGEFLLGLSQTKDILVTFLLPGILCFLVSRKDTSAQKFMELCCNWTVCLVLIKVLIFCYSILSGIPVVQVMENISTLFGVVLMSFDLSDLGGRVHFVSDFLIPPVLYYYIALRKKAFGLAEILVFVLLLFSVVVSFTRYLWLYSVVAIFLACLSGGTNSMRASTLAAGLVAILLLSFGDIIIELVELRFSSDVAGASDIERVIQIDSLYRWFLDAPIFGHGLGAYTRETIRSELLPYSYEVQLLALLGQIGIVGCTILAVILGCFYWSAVQSLKNIRSTIFIGVLLVMWVGGGIFNPNLFSSAAAVIFAAFWAMLVLNSGEDKPRASAA